MGDPTEVGEVRGRGARRFRDVLRCLSVQTAMDSCRVVVSPKATKITLKVNGIPEQRLVEIFSPGRADRSLHERGATGGCSALF